MLAGARGVFPLRGLFIPCPLTVDGDVSSLTSLPRGNYLASGLQWFTLGRERELSGLGLNYTSLPRALSDLRYDYSVSCRRRPGSSYAGPDSSSPGYAINPRVYSHGLI
jgi:hypothetical protein